MTQSEAFCANSSHEPKGSESSWHYTLNEEIEEYDVEALSDHIQELYNNGEMSSTQYDDLMSYLQDM